MNRSQLCTIQQIADSTPAITESMLRYWIDEAKADGKGTEALEGLRRCIVRIGRRIFIDGEAFEAWLEHHKLGRPA